MRRWSHGDIVKLAGALAPFDVVILAAVGDTLGDVATTVTIVRRYVRPGGLIVISDGFIEDQAATRPQGFANYANLASARRMLVAAGDRIVHEWIGDDDDEEDAEAEAGAHDPIRERAQRLAIDFPELAHRFAAFVASQAATNAFLEEHFSDAIWVLQREDDAGTAHPSA